MENLKDLSRKDFDGASTIENINAGSLQRIAAACEIMATNFVKLQNDYKYMKERRDYYHQRTEELQRSVIGLKGVIGKMKKKLIK